jgi:hypothetical protein
MADWIQSGRVVDVILVLMAAEAALLIGLWRWKRAGLPPAATLAMLGAGALLLLAFRLAIDGASALAIAACLTGALLVHGADLAMRWRHAEANRENRDRR